MKGNEMNLGIDLLTSDELAQELRVPAEVVELLAEEERIPSMQVPVRILMFDRAAVRAAMPGLRWWPG